MQALRGHRWWFLVGLLALLACTAISVGVLWYRGNVDSVDKDIQTISGMGMPTNYQGLVALAPTSGEDAGPYYAKFRSTKSNKNQEAAEDNVADIPGLSTTTIAQREEAADELRTLVAPLLMGSTLPRWSVGPTPSAIQAYRKYELQITGVDRGVDILSQMATADIESGHRDEGLSELRACNRIAGQIGPNPAFMAASYAENDLTRVRSSCRRLMAAQSHDGTLIQDLIAILQSAPPEPDIRKALFELFVRNVTEYKKKNPEGFWKTHVNDSPDDLAAAIKQQRLDAQTFRIWKEGFKSLPKGSWTWEQVEQAFDQASLSDPSAAGPGTYLAAAKGMAPVWAIWVAKRHMFLTAASLYLVRAKTGALPTELPPSQDSMDPFSGKPLIYRPSAKGFTIYSVGPDRQDDGGQNFSRKTGDHYDLVYKFSF